ncbi:hypothetical protein SPHINGOAX6_20341 [Sphingomonas sp. AX6]|nr:hypothetical protein SPHINGOAX6_20341 [Sphingomonas sp. AX6]
MPPIGSNAWEFLFYRFPRPQMRAARVRITKTQTTFAERKFDRVLYDRLSAMGGGTGPLPHPPPKT